MDRVTTIRREFVYTYDLEGTQTGVLAEFVDFSYDLRLDTSEELIFVVPGDHPHNDLIVEDQEVRWRGKRFYVGKPETKRDSSRIMLSVTCPALWYRLTDAQIIGAVTLDDLAVQAGAELLLSAAVGPDLDEWTIDINSSATTFSYEAVDTSLLAALRAWAALTGTHLRFDTEFKTIRFDTDSGRDRGVGFRYGRNVRTVKRTAIAPRFTRLYAYGADGLTLQGLASALYIEDFSWYTGLGVPLPTAEVKYLKVRRFEDASIIDDATLMARATALLTEGSQGTLSYEMTVADLSEFLGVTERFVPGDTVRVADTPLGVDVRTTLTRYLEKPLKPSASVVELSYIVPAAANIPQGNTAGGGSKQWLLFGKNNGATYHIRNNATATLNRIGLNFRPDGEAMFWNEMRFTGVGAGSLQVSAVDADTNELLSYPHTLPYTNGQVQHLTLLSAWKQELSGLKDYRIRVQPIATGGGASSASGINVEPEDSKFFIHSYAAVRQTVQLPNSETFVYTGAVQTWTAPDGVYEAQFDVTAGSGAGTVNSPAGAAGQVVARFAVVPGTVYNIYVGQSGGLTGSVAGGWPNGGRGGQANNDGSPGGGASYVILASADTGVGIVTGALIVAGAGGGGADNNNNQGAGGDGGFFAGTNPATGSATGATQFAPGLAGGIGGEDGDTDGRGFGGDGQDSGASSVAEGGGGGGGWYGGGGSKNGVGQGGGGGGSGYLDPSGFDLEANDASHHGNGVIVVSWPDPLIS